MTGEIEVLRAENAELRERLEIAERHRELAWTEFETRAERVAERIVTATRPSRELARRVNLLANEAFRMVVDGAISDHRAEREAE